jgi:adenylate cyclase
METLHHRLAAVWFADIVGYTRQATEDEERALRVVQAFQEAAREVVRRGGGRIVKFIGDATLAEFASTEAAVRAALQLRSACGEHARRAGVECPTLRIAVHVGDVATTDDGDVYGDGVNLAARIVREVEPGEVWVSEDVWRQLRHRPRFTFEERGAPELKGLDPVALYAVTGEEVGRWEGVGAVPAGAAGRYVRKLKRARAAPIALATALALIAAVVAWAVFGPERLGDGSASGGRTTAPASRVAVLYFDDHSEGRLLRHLADGMTEALIHDLSQIRELDVISREGVKRFRDSQAPLDSVAGALGAGTLVEGSVAQSGDRVRVTAQLIDAADLTHLASIEAERPRGELFALQDELVDEISRALRLRLGHEIRLELSRRATGSVEAWELVQRAEGLREQADQAHDDAVSTELRRRADAHLARAEALDPRWVEPVLLRARLVLDAASAGLPGSGREGDAATLQRGLGLIERALGMAPESARALDLRGQLEYRLAELVSDSARAADQLARAERDLRTAVASDPSLAGAWITLADLLYNAKWELVPAMDAARRAYDEDAFLLERRHYEWLSEIALQLERYDEAVSWVSEGRKRYPEWVSLPGIEIAILASQGGPDPDPARAWSLVGKVEELAQPEARGFYGAVARIQAAAVLARAGARDSARAVAARARRLTSAPAEQAFLDYYEAYLRVVLGETEAAIPLLRSFVTTYPEYRARVARDYWFEDLAGDPRFEALGDRRRWPIFCRILCQPPVR